MVKKSFYITTPIYYANDRPHIGHAYTTILADVINRYHRLLGYETFFLTGTDEHGQKVEQAARQRGVTPQQQVDEFHVRFKELWERLDISYDRFIRTTDEDHKTHVQESLQELYDRGEIYLKEYAGWYSVGEERLFSEDELVDGKDPVSGKPVDWIAEKNYFFKMGQYQDRLIEHIQNNSDFIQPEFRKNEVLGFLRQPLHDLCISRPVSRLSWGIPLPFDKEFVTYVWFDALLNYESGVLGKQFSNGRPAWPADYHIIGKDILTTHAVYWPTMLMGLGRELPRHILAHGWWLNRGEKQSKSKGNAVNPLDYVDRHGVDSVRYFLVRDMVLGQDASFTDELFTNRINAELANDLGNAINRISKFTWAHYDGVLPGSHQPEAPEQELKQLANATLARVQSQVQVLNLSTALEEIATLVRGVNRYVEHRAPWKLAKDPAQREAMGSVLYHGAEALRVALSLLWPVMPGKCRQGLAMLGCAREPSLQDLIWGGLRGGEQLAPAIALFPRIELTLREEDRKPDDAFPLDLRVSQIKSVSDHPEADSLYVLSVDTGGESRTICAGLKKSYEAADLEGRKVVVVANLKPAKLRGITSQGMVLAADGPDGRAILIDPGSIAVGVSLQAGNRVAKPKAKASTEDLEALKPVVNHGRVESVYGPLHFGKAPVTCGAPDGASVH